MFTMHDKRFKCFVAGMVVVAITWSVSLYFDWVLSSENSFERPRQPHSRFFDGVIIPYEEGISPDKGKEKYIRLADIARQKLRPILRKMSDDGLDNPGRVQNLEDLKFRDDGYKTHGFNTLVSRNLDYHRAVPDTRNILCKNETFDQDLPRTSVVICFYNEQFDTLLRSLHSLIDRTPDSLLEEIILVDDYSDMKGLHDSVAEYVKSLSLEKVKLFRTDRREGLIRARIFGADLATGQALVFLDSHIEVNVMWLEPLLQRIKYDKTRVATPIIDIINSDTFEYKSSPIVRGGFNWGLHFKWINVPNESLGKEENFIKPITSPTMAGGLFAISKKYFDNLGKYDSGMNIWGGENIEISFRIWQCGGSIEIIPCSRIGHVFRKHRPYGSPDGEDTMLRNSLRVANVWMDEYKDEFYKQRPEASKLSYGDITSRLELKTKLKCKPFSWYLKNVYPELLTPGGGGEAVGASYRRKSNNYVGSYQIRLSGTSYCVASEKDVKTKGSKLVLRSCLRIKNQLWFKTDKEELKLAQYLCMDALQDEPLLGKCHEMGGTQEWKHKASNSMAIYNSALGTCLSAVEIMLNSRLVMAICNQNNLSQWDFVPVAM